MIELNKQQMKYLRKYAQKEKAIFQIGKLGLTEVFIQQVEAALNKRELVKFNVLQNSDEEIKEVAQQLSEVLQAVVVQTIGNTAILYRPSQESKNQKLSLDIQELS
ncbi:YhbY family RNA-binding protein [Facklamia languida]|uniref:YhbY family putative RNA-binding protein n=1 Tax=Facklamia languida CCUG 37842 TaxID=883113 RepID=H3NHX8_9LACT|nr:YhbY family RNA-binding protein [Facklamia languida]EHR37777.1 YhbY family putative RNA-binding protein [Facklamia languida CCUG 37842]